MTDTIELPARFPGLFGIALFHQHHGQLLLRSADRDDGGPRRVDLLFRGVVWMSLPAWFENFTVEQCLTDEIIDRIPRGLHGKVESRKCYRLDIEGRPHYVIAGGLRTASDDGAYFDASPLMTEVEVNLRFDGS